VAEDSLRKFWKEIFKGAAGAGGVCNWTCMRKGIDKQMIELLRLQPRVASDGIATKFRAEHMGLGLHAGSDSAAGNAARETKRQRVFAKSSGSRRLPR